MNHRPLLKTLHYFGSIDWDIVVIGGGATGAGIALDATARGFNTLLLEQADFGTGTSSRSTKLLHGGVRYLAQGDILLVMEALQERGMILKNAPHLTSNQEFVIPVYTWWDVIKYTVGLKFYDLLAGRLSLGRSRFIKKRTTLIRLPLIRTEKLKGGVIYHDGQFDDSRLLISLVKSILDKGGSALNYCRVTGLVKNKEGKICGVKATADGGTTCTELRSRVVINATGVFADDLLKMDRPLTKRTIRPSQGVHLVFNSSFLQSNSAIMIPKTVDGRVLFAIPWYGKVVAGTTDTPVDSISLEPKALQQEIDFIIQTAGNYLTNKPLYKDVLCVYAGLRPLAANPDDPSNTREISRRHKITISPAGLVTTEGGKWTTYRRMAEDTLNKVMRAGLLEKKACLTRHLPVNGYSNDKPVDRLHIYGSHAPVIRAMMEEPGMAKQLHPRLPYTVAEIRWICRNEMVIRLEDVLARRTRALLLDAMASREMAPEVADIMAEELGLEDAWKATEIDSYIKLTENYLCNT